MLLRRGDRRGQSMWIAWGKLLGTLTASISQYLYDPGNVLWLVLYIEILILDVLYVFLLSKAPRYERVLSGVGRVGSISWAQWPPTRRL
jgi:hypothetical protein